MGGAAAQWEPGQRRTAVVLQRRQTRVRGAVLVAGPSEAARAVAAHVVAGRGGRSADLTVVAGAGPGGHDGAEGVQTLGQVEVRANRRRVVHDRRVLEEDVAGERFDTAAGGARGIRHERRVVDPDLAGRGVDRAAPAVGPGRRVAGDRGLVDDDLRWRRIVGQLGDGERDAGASSGLRVVEDAGGGGGQGDLLAGRVGVDRDPDPAVLVLRDLRVGDRQVTTVGAVHPDATVVARNAVGKRERPAALPAGEDAVLTVVDDGGVGDRRCAVDEGDPAQRVLGDRRMVDRHCAETDPHAVADVGADGGVVEGQAGAALGRVVVEGAIGASVVPGHLGPVQDEVVAELDGRGVALPAGQRGVVDGDGGRHRVDGVQDPLVGAGLRNRRAVPLDGEVLAARVVKVAVGVGVLVQGTADRELVVRGGGEHDRGRPGGGVRVRDRLAQRRLAVGAVHDIRGQGHGDVGGLDRLCEPERGDDRAKCGSGEQPVSTWPRAHRYPHRESSSAGSLASIPYAAQRQRRVILPTLPCHQQTGGPRAKRFTPNACRFREDDPPG